MNRTAPARYAIEQEDTGSIRFDLECIPSLNKSPPHLSIADLEVAGNSVNIGGSDKKNRTGQPITAKTGTGVAKSSI